MGAMPVSPLVKAEVVRRFEKHDAWDVERLLKATVLPFLDAADRDRERDRVHLAILKIADGDFTKFAHALALAADDWRDALMAAGMGHANWPEVLKDAGYPVP
jgi:hypothetical protein